MLGKNQRSPRPQMGTCSNSNTVQNSSTVTVARLRTSVGLKLAVRGDSGADGLAW